MSAEKRSNSDVTGARPNALAKWHCGYQYLGFACEEGPDKDGRCCQETHRIDGCAENECEHNCDGAAHCELSKLRRAARLPSHHELGPCLPQRNSWFSRQTLALNMAILVGGVLLLCMALPKKEELFVPGELSQKHAQILGNTLVSDRCSLCHPNSHSVLSGDVIQDDLCLKCHEKHMPDAGMRIAHDITTDQMSELRAQMGRLVSSQQIEHTKCAMCHVEHHGSGHDLKAMTDMRCQSCHQKQFESFADGHPQFDQYPYRTKRRIAFDHQAHRDKHFAQKEAEFDCSSCHVSDQRTGAVGTVFRTLGFEESCAECHTESIESAATNGWVLLQVPSIMQSDREDPQLGLDDWPDASVYDYDGQITVPMRALLGMAFAIESNQIASIERKRRADVTRALAQEFRSLIREVAEGGQAAWQRRLTEAAEHRLRRPLTQSEHDLVQRLCIGLPPDLFRQMELDWFGPKDRLAGNASNIPLRFASTTQTSDDSSEHGELLDGELLTEDQSLEDELGDAALADSLLLDESADDLLSNEMEDSEDALAPSAGDISSSRSKLTQVRASDHLASGGWFLDPSIMALRYKPRGHADPTIAAWNEFVLLLESPPGSSGRRGDEMLPSQPHGSSLSREIPGGCTECHLLEPPSAGGLNQGIAGISWRQLERPENLKLFTRFDHGPHLTLPTLSNCTYCHVLPQQRSETTSKETSTIRDRLTSLHDGQEQAARNSHGAFRDEFRFMERGQCVACHHEGGANSGCTQCHHYHVGQDAFEWSHHLKSSPEP